mmetsp:Transcript_913/g.3448  ORF Transcript_913/g.3448 Transcript_913/m.3448 type:complete len:268 (-) Transcript_913:734-1537(-)
MKDTSHQRAAPLTHTNARRATRPSQRRPELVLRRRVVQALRRRQSLYADEVRDDSLLVPQRRHDQRVHETRPVLVIVHEPPVELLASRDRLAHGPDRLPVRPRSLQEPAVAPQHLLRGIPRLRVKVIVCEDDGLVLRRCVGDAQRVRRPRDEPGQRQAHSGRHTLQAPVVSARVAPTVRDRRAVPAEGRRVAQSAGPLVPAIPRRRRVPQRVHRGLEHREPRAHALRAGMQHVPHELRSDRAAVGGQKRVAALDVADGAAGSARERL